MFRKKQEPTEIELKPTGVQHYSDSDTNEEVEIQDTSEKMNTLFNLPGMEPHSSESQYSIISKIDRMLDQNERIIRLLEEIVKKRDLEKQNPISSSVESKSSSQYYDKPFEERRLW